MSPVFGRRVLPGGAMTPRQRLVRVGVDGQEMLPLPTWSDRLVVPYESVYQSGDRFQDVIANRLPAAGCYVVLPPGFDELIYDFTQSNYGVYAPRCYGLWGYGPTQARIRLAPGSSTKSSLVPPQVAGGSQTNPLWVIRLGPNNSSAQAALHVHGLTFEGSDQGHAYNGFSSYMPGAGSTYEHILFRAFAKGTWNSPPGETNIWSNYMGQDSSTGFVTTMRDVESDGRASDGWQAGAAFSTTGSGSLLLEDVYVHDSEVSGVTLGTAGSVTTGTLTRNVTTRRLRIENNANISASSGQTFCALNHEGVRAIRHEGLDITLRGPGGVINKEHLAINNSQESAKVDIIEPVWRNGPTWANGKFAVSVDDSYPNQQQLAADITVVKNGVTLTPVSYANRAQGAPDTHYILANVSF